MTNRYVRSGDGNDADNGTTWALANATLAGSISDSSAGDWHLISDNHSEETGGAVTLTFKGTVTAPDRVLCVDDAGDPEPPTALATSGLVATGNGAYSITINGFVYVYGVTFRVGVGATATNSGITQASQSVQQYENCNFEIATTSNSVSSRIVVGTDSTASVLTCDWKNCNVKFGGVAQIIAPWLTRWSWVGGAITSGSAAISTIFKPNQGAGFNRAVVVSVENVDFTNAASNANLIDTTNAVSDSSFMFRNCKLPSSCVIRAGTAGCRVEVYNCDSGDTNYRLWIDDRFGTIKDSITAGYTVYRDGGAGGADLFNGATEQSGMSWLVATNASAEFPALILASPEIVRFVDSTGSKTITVDICHDGASALTDQDIWLDVVSYLGTSGSPLGKTDVTDRGSLVATSGTAQTSSTSAWTGDTGTGPNGSTTWHTLKLTTTITVNEVGYLHCRVCMAKASSYCFVDPILQIS